MSDHPFHAGSGWELDIVELRAELVTSLRARSIDVMPTREGANAKHAGLVNLNEWKRYAQGTRAAEDY